jgi:nitrate/nitrite transport system substrate-binding protein
MDLNGNAITVANSVWAAMAPQLPRPQAGQVPPLVSAAALKPVVAEYRQGASPSTWGWSSPSPPQLRAQVLAGGRGLHPGFYAPKLGDNSGQRQADVLLSVTPPPQMPATLEAGTIAGYSVGEPWNQQAVARG